MSGYTYDTGALVAAERGHRRMWLLHNRALARGVRPTVPAAVLAQAWRGGPQAQLSRLLAGCRIEALDEEDARSSGRACALSATSDVVDASVVVDALSRGHTCVTSDADDLQAVAAGLGRQLPIVAI